MSRVSRQNLSLGFSVLTTVFVFSLAPKALAVSGEGRNGPDTSVVSIPIQIDRGVKDYQIGNAIYTCLVAGDEKRGLTSIGQRWADILFGVQTTFKNKQQSIPTYVLYYKNSIMLDGTFEFRNLKDKKEPYFGVDIKLSCGANQESDDAVEDNNARCAMELYVLNSGGSATLLTTRDGTHAGGLPFISFDKKTDETEYNELGNEIGTSTIVSGLSIKTEGARFLDLMNRDTGRVLPNLKVDTQEYIECLKSEIEQKAK